MSTEHCASGNWLVKPGSEDAFIDRWREWLSTSSSGVEGFVSARLLRSPEEPRRFVSISEWSDAGARDVWKERAGFIEGFTACRDLCEEFQGGDFNRVVDV